MAEEAGTGLRERDCVSVSFLSSKKMEEVNRDFLNHKGDTDVICFDYRESVSLPLEEVVEESEEACVDILICPAVAEREALKRFLPYSEEVTLYLAHGLLHAGGQDDLKPELKRKMRAAERRIMKLLKREFDLNEIFPEPRELN